VGSCGGSWPSEGGNGCAGPGKGCWRGKPGILLGAKGIHVPGGGKDGGGADGSSVGGTPKP
jgi:hypothetical protein